jgi:hypothetical protein
MIALMSDAAAEEGAPGDADAALSGVVKEMFKSDGRSEKDFSAAAGISTRTFQRVKNGETGWSVANLVAVARGFGVDPSAILVRAHLSAQVLDPVSAISQCDFLSPAERGAFIALMRAARERNQASAQQ